VWAFAGGMVNWGSTSSPVQARRLHFADAAWRSKSTVNPGTEMTLAYACLLVFL
jgi:hypothetical protein